MLKKPHDRAPGLASPIEAINRALEALRPPARVSVSECAERHRRLRNVGSYVGPWRNDLAPHLVEIQDKTTARDVSTLVYTGPPQFSGKSEVCLNIVAHAAKYAGRDILLFQPTEDLARDFGKRRVRAKLFDVSPDLAGCIAEERGADNILEKRFRNGALLTISHPTTAELSSRPVPVVVFDERDSMPDAIGEEGDPVELGRNRTSTFGNAGKVVVVSSLKRRDKSGTIVLYEQGTRRLWFWPCPHCGEYWAAGFDGERRPTFDHLRWRGWPSKAVQPAVALASAFLACPSCGAVVEENHKAAMNRRGVWLAAGQTIEPSGEIHGEAPATRTESYWFCALASNFARWGQLAHDLLDAEGKYERTLDEEPLAAVWNRFGFPYREKNAGAGELERDELAARRDVAGYELRTVPALARFLTAAVDVQGDRFEVGVVAWGEQNEAWLVDRFAVRRAGGGEAEIRPGEYPEHWAELLGRVFAARYPLAARPGSTLGVANVAIDTGGVAGVDDNARSFYTLARDSGVADWGITLVKGAALASAPVWKPPRLETDKRGRFKAGTVPIYDVGVSRLKDTVANRLRRRDAGPGYVHLPRGLEDRYVDELVAERKDGNAWVRKGANETWDLLVYATFAAQRMRAHRVNWASPPTWPVWARPKQLAPSENAARGGMFPARPDARGEEAGGARDPAPPVASDDTIGASSSAHDGTGALRRTSADLAAAIAAARQGALERPLELVGTSPPPRRRRHQGQGWGF